MKEKNKQIFGKRIIRLVVLPFLSFVIVAVIGFKYYNKNIGINVRAASDGCPSSDWVPIGDSCIMDDLLNSTDENWGESAYSCLDDEGARLCTTYEWMEACRLNEGNVVTINDMETDGTDNYEWVGDIENADNEKAVMIGKNGCGDISSDDIKTSNHKRRCCVNKERY